MCLQQGVTKGCLDGRASSVARMRLAFWKRATAPPPPAPADPLADLRRLLYQQLGAVPPRFRQDAYWVMDRGWQIQVTAALAESGPPGMPPAPADGQVLSLLGIEVVVTDGGGWPHLEPGSRAKAARRVSTI